MDADKSGVTLHAHPATKEPERATWLRVAEVAHLLGMSANTVRRWTDAGRIPAHRSPGGHRRYLLDEILALAPEVELAPVLDLPAAKATRAAGAETAVASPPGPEAGPLLPEPPERASRGDARGPALDADTLADLVTVLSETPHELPARAARLMRELTDAGRCEILALEGDNVEVLVSVDAGGDDVARVGRLRALSEWHMPAGDDAAAPVALRRGAASVAAAAALRQRGCHSLLWAPLVVGGTRRGALEITDARDRDLAAYLPLAHAVARLVGHALDVRATRSALDERRRTMRELLALSQEVARATDLWSFVQTVAERVMTATNADYVDVWQVQSSALRALVSMSRDGVDEQHRGTTMDLRKYPASALAFAASQPFVLCSTRDERLTNEEVRLYHEWGFESSLSVPIVVGGEMVGLIELYDDAEREWGDEVDFLTNVCQHVAGIFANTVLLDEVQRRAAYERELVGLAEGLSQAAQIHDFAATAAETLRRVLDVEDCDIWHLDEGRLRCLVSVDRTGIDTAVEGKLLDLELFPTTAVALAERELLLFADLEDPRLTPDEIEDWAEYGFHSGMTLPLVAGDDVVGMIDVFDTRERDYTEGREFLISAGRMVADGLQNAQLLSSLQQSNRGLRELVELGDVIAEAEDLGTLVRTVAGRLREVLRAEDCDIWRVEGDRLRCLASIDSNGWDEGEIDVTRELATYPNTIVALERNEPIVLGDFDLAPDALADDERASYDRWGFRSMVSLPLVLDGRPVGLVDIFDTRPRDWTELMDLIRNVGALVAGAIAKAVLLDQLERSNSELRLLVQSSLDFGATLDQDAVIDTVARRIREISGADMCDVYALDGDEVEILVSVGGEGEFQAKGLRYTMTDFHMFLEAFSTRAPAEVFDVRADPRSTPEDIGDAEEWGYRATADIPLVVHGDVIGFVSLYGREPRHFPKMDAMVGLAQIAAQAIANAKLFRQLDDNARRLGLVTEATLELTSTLDLQDVLTRLAWRLCRSVDVPDCEISVIEGSDLVSVMSLTDGVVDRDWIGFRLPLAEAGVTREVMRTKRPTVVASLDDPRLSDHARALNREQATGDATGGKCWVTLPLIAADQVIGIVELVETRGPRSFTEDEIEAAAAICHAAAMALTNARLFSREQAAHRETTILNEIARSTAASLDVDDVAAAAARQLERLVDFDGFALLLVTDGKVTSIVTDEGDAYPFEAADFATADEAFARRLLAEGTVVLRLPDESPLPPDHPAMAGLRRMAILALVADAGLIGALALVSHKEDAFEDLNRGLFTRVANQLSLAVANARLYEEIKAMHLGNLKALSSALNAKDYYTLGHAARVAAYMVMLGEELGWSEGLLESVEEAAYLHDIGKISISDRVLLKPGRLNDREWEQMQQHPVFSADIIRPLFPEALVLAVRHHHEHYGGGGYPDGLKGEQIPELARAMAVVDAYDAMSCRRPYKAALTYPECLAELERCRGSQFDPAMVDVFLRVLQRVFERRNTANRIASMAADRIPGEWHVVLHGPEDEGTAEYERIAGVLRQVRDANPPTRFLTTHCRIDKRYVIAVDPEENEAEHSRFGDEIFADDELPLVLEGRVPDVNILFADQFGVWVTGLAPIRDKGGRVVAAVVADLPAVEGPAGDSLGSDARQSFASMLQSAAVRLSRAEIDAITDALTGLYNHRYLHERLSEELARAREHERPLSLLFCDLDHFKEYNDRNSHSAGDAALREVAHIIEQSVRSIDIAARYGGEEFVVALVETARPDALTVAERIRARLESTDFGGGGEPLTVSIGVATFPEDASRREELLDKADWAMYSAKRQGRNRIVPFAAESE
jgi:diguanylate cyclase (GGDEF)-like protein/excisionase family DNA binding protein